MVDKYTAAFVKKLLPIAKRAQARFGISAAYIVTQAVHEASDPKRKLPSGLSVLADKYNNLFGIAGESWKKAGKPTVDLGTSEWIPVKDGAGKVVRDGAGKPVLKEVHLSRPFRRYDSWEASVFDYAGLISTAPWFKEAYQAGRAGSALDYFNALEKGGYATDPNYGTKLATVYDRIKGALV